MDVQLYDFKKETDKDFLREAGMMLQQEVVALRIKVHQLEVIQTADNEIKSKLTGQLLVLRRRIFDSKQEKKAKLKKLKKDKKRNNINLLHNTNDNKADLEAIEKEEIQLEVKEEDHKLESSKCPHCGKDHGLEEMKGMFEESTEYDVNFVYYILKRHKRQKYKCSHCKEIVTAKGGAKLTPGGKFSIQMAVQVASNKFEHHIPLDRQRKMMKRAGVNVSAKSLYSMTSHLYNLLQPLDELNRQNVIGGRYVGIDESPTVFYNPNKSTGYAWSMSNNIGAYYQFEPTRSGDVAREMVAGFIGVVITDGYAGYDFLNKTKEITHAYCWAHMRRYFFDAMSEDPDAGEVVDLIDLLYELEHNAQSYEELKLLRRTRSTQIFNDIESWINENESHYLGSTLTGKAINYFYNQKEGLSHFLTNEYTPLDNNVAERSQRCPVLGKKNYKGFKSIDGADIGMFYYSIIESCKINGLNPESYMLEMALRKVKNDEELESPYIYAQKLKSEAANKIKASLVN